MGHSVGSLPDLTYLFRVLDLLCKEMSFWTSHVRRKSLVVREGRSCVLLAIKKERKKKGRDYDEESLFRPSQKELSGKGPLLTLI